MWLLFVKGVRERWVELALTALVVGLAVAALVAQRAVTASAEKSVHDLAHRLGRNMLVVPAQTDLAAFYQHRYEGESLPDSLPATLRSSPVGQHLQSIEARLYGNAAIGQAAVLVVGQDSGWPANGDLQPAVLGAEAARRTGLASGQAFQLGGVAFQVMDVTASPPDALDDAVFMPMAAAQQVLGRPGRLSALRLGGCWCQVDVPTMGRQIEQLVPGVRAVTVAGMLRAQKGSVEAMQRYSGVLAVAGFAAVAAIVGALTAARVRRRARELGLLVAIGAAPVGIGGLVVLEAALVGAAGAAMGWAAAIPIARQQGAHLQGATLEVPAGLLLPHLLIAAGVCAVAALIPASRAASLDPSVVLREA
jgi:putative ABC transport system permease protein